MSDDGTHGRRVEDHHLEDDPASGARMLSFALCYLVIILSLLTFTFLYLR